MSPASILPLLGLPFLLGSGLSALIGIRARDDLLGWLGWSWAAGGLGTGALIFLWGLPPLPWSALGIGGTLVALALLLHGLARRRAPGLDGRADPPRGGLLPRGLFWFVFALVLVSMLDRIAVANLLPVWNGDEGHIYASFAHVLFHAGGWVGDFGELVRRSAAVNHPDYPLLDPLLQVWTFALAGEIVHFANRLPIQAFSVAALFVLASGLRRRAHPLVGALLLLVFASVKGSPRFDLLGTAYADGMCALGLLIAIDAWMRFEEDGARRWSWLAGIGLAVSAASKNEGLLFVAIFLFVVAARLVSRRGRGGGAWALARVAGLALVPIVLNAWIDRRYGFAGDLAGANDLGRPIWELAPAFFGQRAAPVARYVLEEVVLRPESSRLLFALFLLLLVLVPARAWRGALFVPSALLLISMLGFALVFVGTPHPLEWHLRTACVRVFDQLLPATTLWIGVVVSRELPRRA